MLWLENGGEKTAGLEPQPMFSGKTRRTAATAIFSRSFERENESVIHSVLTCARTPRSKTWLGKTDGIAWIPDLPDIWLASWLNDCMVGS